MKTNICILFFVLIANISTTAYSQNLVPNSSFEQYEYESSSSYLPSADGQIEETKYWKKFNTSDWYGDNSGYFKGYFDPTSSSYSGGANGNIMPAHTGNRFIGFGSCEGAQVQLTDNIDEMHWVNISFWFSPRGRCNTQLNAYLLKQQADSNALANCTVPAMGSSIHFEMNIDATYSGDYTPGRWYYVQFEPKLVTNDEYEWLAIKGENISGALGSYNYVYIDDISITQMDFCDNICAKSNGGVTATSIIPNAMIGNYGLNFFATFQNANELTFRVFNRWGCLIYESYNYDPNSLVDPGYDDFAIVWNGNRNIINPCNTSYADVIVPDLYTITINATSCTGADYYYIGDLTVVDIYSPPAVPYPATQNSEVDCCPTDKYYQNHDFYSNSRTDVDNAIIAGSNVTGGTTGPVIVHVNANVKFYAGNAINLEPGFSIESGGLFSAYIQPCGQTERMYSPRSLREQYENMRKNINEDSIAVRLYSKIKIAPNPNAGQFTITGLNTNDFRENSVITITNMYGSIVYKTETTGSSISVDLSMLSKGIYLVKVENYLQKIQIEKIVIE